MVAVSQDIQPPDSYIEKVDLATGDRVGEAIEPKQLLVQSHRDYHVVDVYAQHLMSRIVKRTGNEELARQAMKEVRRIGHKVADKLADRFGFNDPDKLKQKLFGLKDREYYFRFKTQPHDPAFVEETIARQRKEAEELLAATAGEDGVPQVRVLLTGGTGFVGKEIMWQAVKDPAVAEMVVLIRPKTIRDRKTKEVIKVLSPADRGEKLLDQLWITDPADRAKFRFVAGDIEKPRLGISDEDWAGLTTTITHVIHCAASVSFDAPYDESYSANVLGSLNALATSLALQQHEGSKYVAHLSVETSYIHGRQARRQAREDEIVFPRNFYNNYYELTKAMASIETERFMLDHGLRVTQLCPAIVIGDARTGNNRGDMKVVNAPVNAFGRAKEALSTEDGNWADRSKGKMLARMACIFPGDPTAELNLIPVDRVVAGIVSALTKPAAVGDRIHLATDNRVSAQRIRDICAEEIDVDVKLASPTMHRTVTLPVITKLLTNFKQPKLANALEKLGNIFGSYSEWGQPVHQVGNDVTVLGLSDKRPVTEEVFRMLCRHNRYVQEFGKMRDDDEISRREKVWTEFIDDLEKRYQQRAGEIASKVFHTEVEERIDLGSWTLRG